ncbi:uracil-DNA glycosylase family protein [Roseibacillus persicicus]|uniref:Single-strand selective monofunctional uracil DNA glycosylase n=1 Tax=Roseibacillus persicicus TaxID=454148 RepID=A0A918WFK1_9BACT|nr:uracil-DNA glycosylase family protein [Roseibacillus persicicus]GHC46603.1 single-strand selective monofunctional uracil DNA glycosylase [Roseibacillus persicicus]
MNALISAADTLRQELRGLTFPAPVTHTYNPLEYAWERHCDYLEKYGNGTKRVLFLGMNPGPYGMAQTGVPFGEIEHVRDWLGIDGPVGKPDPEHPKRPITGFDCTRSEVSGKRLWGLFRETYPDPQDFFAGHFIANYCPLVWMKDTGANLTPDKLPAASLVPVEEACLAHLQTLIQTLQPEFLIGVGAYAETKLKQAAGTIDYPATLGRILHPSPASPAANRGWAEAATKQLLEQDIWD